MAQEIVSRHKHNMLSLLYATCLKLLVFFLIAALLLRLVQIKNEFNISLNVKVFFYYSKPSLQRFVHLITLHFFATKSLNKSIVFLQNTEFFYYGPTVE